MSTEVRLPQWGMGMLEGALAAWVSKAGDEVRAGDVIAEIEAAKSTEELTAPVDGIVLSHEVEEGAMVPVHAVVATIGSAEEWEALAAAASPAPRPPAGAASGGAIAPAPAVEDGAAGSSRIAIVPLARKRAVQLGVDLAAVVGSGPQGRITVADVERAAEGVPDSDPIAITSPVRDRPTEGAAPGLSRMRQVISERMMASLHSSAQLTLTTTVDVTDVVAFRRGVSQTPPPAFLDFVIRAAAAALRNHPAVNARWVDGGILRQQEINIGFAVSLDDGLVVPVIAEADRLSLAEISALTRRLAAQAREGRLGPAAMDGGTFTVTSLGGQGIDTFTPILNPGQSAILGVGRVREQPRRFGDGLVWRDELTLSLTIDHRVLDGAPSAEFLRDLSSVLSRDVGEGR